jgi:hypothetical protein
MSKQLDVAAKLNEALAELAEHHGFQQLTIHPDCNMFPLMDEKEIRETAADIKAHGLRENITIKIVAANRAVLWDGRNQIVACSLAKVMPHMQPPPKGVTASEFIISKNIMRRHLTPSERLKLIDKLLKDDPTQSDRRIAETVKASPTTVAKERKKAEARGDVSKVDTRTDSKGRKQPASKPKAAPDDHIIARTNEQQAARRADLKVVTASPEVSIEERKAENAALDTPQEDRALQAFSSQPLIEGMM